MQRDAARAPRDNQTGKQSPQVIDQQHDIRRFGRSRSTACAHGDTNTRRCQSRCIVHTVANHHHRPGFPCINNDLHLSIRREISFDAIKTQTKRQGLCHIVAVTRCKHDPVNSGAT